MRTIQSAECDVCIVGSGAGGGMTAHALTQAGARVVMLEAGGKRFATEDSPMLMWPYESPRRGASTFKRQFGEFDACDGGRELEGEPYTRAAGSQFDWWRARMLGGRTKLGDASRSASAPHEESGGLAMRYQTAR